MINVAEFMTVISALVYRHKVLTVTQAHQLTQTFRQTNEIPVEQLLAFCSEQRLRPLLAAESGVEWVDLDSSECELDIDAGAIERFEKQAGTTTLDIERALPLRHRDTGEPVIVVAELSNARIADQLRGVLDPAATKKLASGQAIQAALARHWLQRTHAARPEVVEPRTVPSRPQSTAVPSNASSSEPVQRYVAELLSAAVGIGASDILFDQEGSQIRARYILDGITVLAPPPPPDIEAARAFAAFASIGNVKIDKLGIDGADSREFSFHAQGRAIRARVEANGTVSDGRSLTIRILDSANLGRSLDDSGLLPEQLRLLRSTVARGTGMVIVAGATGSGKSTTLYATALELDATTRNIITIEDPVEYRIPGFRQIQVRPDPNNPKGGFTFAKAIRSVVRQAPHVILLGEIRDEETAEAATDAAITGHLVLSTVHATRAGTVFGRLAELGVPLYQLADPETLSLAVAQKLVPRVHDCGERRPPTERELELLHERFGSVIPNFVPPDVVTVRRGCDRCGGRGVLGRAVIADMLTPTEEIAEAVAAGAQVPQIMRLARAAGFPLMEEHLLAHHAAGVVPLDVLLGGRK